MRRNFPLSTAPTEFPITLKKGHASVKIYKVKKRQLTNYTVSYLDATGRQRRTFADLDVARREAGNNGGEPQ